jgi:hypothetical protein
MSIPLGVFYLYVHATSTHIPINLSNYKNQNEKNSFVLKASGVFT